MTMEILNPVLWANIRPNMTPAERYFACCLARGKPCFLGNAIPEKASSRNIIRSEVIRFFAYGGDANHPVRGAHIFLQGAWISSESSLDLIYARIPYSLGMCKCHLDLNILMIGAQCVDLSLVGSRLCGNLNGDGAKIGGNLLLRQGFVAEGEIRLIGAHVSGHLDCENGKFHNLKKMAIAADGIQVDGNVRLRGGFSAKGEVRLPTARIGGELDCSDGTFDNPENWALCADGVHVRSRIVMRGASVTGETRLIGAYTNGQLDCGGGRFDGGEGVSFRADGMTASRGIALRGGFCANGTVRLLGACTDGNLDCSGGEFRNLDGKALGADNVRVGGSVFLSGDFFAEGEVRLPNARIGALECAGKFNNRLAVALGATDMEVRGDVTLRANFQGEVLLTGARIGTSLTVVGTFDNPQEVALNAERIEARHGMFWNPKGGGGVVDLAYARVGVLADVIDAWKPFQIILNGFAYDQFFNPADAQSRLGWLSKRPSEMPFSPLPYEQAAKILSGMGHPVDAWDILREKRQLEREHKQVPWWQRVWGQWIDSLTNFVYRPLRTVGWTMGIVLAGAVFFGAADHCERIVPHQPIVLSKKEYQNAREDGGHPFDAARKAVPDYPGFNPLMFSLDVFVPLFNLHQESYWAPNSGKGDFFRWLTRGKGEFEGWWLLTAWYWIEIMAGWLLSSLLLLSVTGLLRPRIGGGD